MTPIFDAILSLLGKFTELARERRDGRDRLADYCAKVADCLEKVYEAKERGQMPWGVCSELEAYTRRNDVFKKVLSETELWELSKTISLAYQVEMLAREHFEDARVIAQAAGKYRALANQLRL